MNVETSEFAYDDRLVWRATIVGAATLVVALGVILFSKGSTLPHWLLSLVTLAALLGAMKIIRGVHKLASRTPAISISNNGIHDAAWGRARIPWEAVQKFKETRVSKKLGGVVVYLDAEKMTWIPGPLHLRIANWVSGGRAGQSGKQIVLLMTPPAALKVGFDDLVDAVDRAASAVGKPFERANVGNP
jgi:hypothetical protein